MIRKKEREQVIGSVSISRWQDYDSWKRSKNRELGTLLWIKEGDYNSWKRAKKLTGNAPIIKRRKLWFLKKKENK